MNLLTIPEAMARLRVSRRTLFRLIANNPAYQATLDQRHADAEWKWRDSEGHPLFSQDECAECSGSDSTGGDFCPVEDYCCGC